ncbi:3-hydroxybutyryl-CoA dehydrogenase [Ligilactobacillus salitolerans]|nr:3-hydroxybutyryl-CoA dehydrogenase [Ligilactobacillus salitolerans]
MEIKKVLVVGAGQMGNGIAQSFAQAGYDVVLNDIKQEFVDRGFAKIKANLARQVEKGRIDQEQEAATLAHLSSSTSYADAADVDLVVEAATENEQIKLDIFRQLDEIAPKSAILSSNTSSISITKITSVTKRHGQVIGLHFFNPVQAMKLVELNVGLTTDEETVKVMKKVGESLGKTVILSKDSPGFVVNRILTPMINEAVMALESGIASADEIDEAMKLGANFPMGPLQLADFIGLDVLLSIMKTLYNGFSDSKYRPAPLLTKYVEAGMLGRKTGQGFYSYE